MPPAFQPHYGSKKSYAEKLVRQPEQIYGVP